MKITLVQPPGLMAVDNYSTITQPPLGIAYLAAYARQHGHEVSVVDAVGEGVTRIRPWPKREKRMFQGLSFPEIVARVPADTEVLGVSCMFTHAWPMVRELILELARAFPQARLIAGGEHVTSMHATVMAETPVEACVLGEGELTFIELLNAMKGGADLSAVPGLALRGPDGRAVKTAKRARIADPDALPWPAWDLLDPMAYLEGESFMGPQAGRSIPMLATRGCPFRCTFCSSPQMWTQVWKARDPKKVADEMEHYMKAYGANDFQFQDLTAIVRKDWIISFCRELINRGLGITWSLPVGTRSEAIDGEVPALLIASGCHHVTYAPESGSEEILKSIEKKVHLDHLERSALDSLAAGMKVCLFLIIGFPQESLEDIKKTLRFIRRMARIGVHEVAVSTFVPLPGTQLFDETGKIVPIVVDDEYCHWMAAATSLWTVRSWNPRFSDRRLLWLKFCAFFQFYALSYLHHPGRLWRLLANALRGRQETKVDRVLHEFSVKLRASTKSSAS
jgi:radical SAM superfamily enzyme YgiQ (UPF0313 family)